MPRLQTLKPTIEEIMHSPGTSHWLHDALETALRRDPVDAANDAETLADLLADRAMSALVAMQKKLNA